MKVLLKTSCRLTLATDGEAGNEIDVVVAPLTTEGVVMKALLVVLQLGEGVIILLVLLLLEPMSEQLSSLVGAVMTV